MKKQVVLYVGDNQESEEMLREVEKLEHVDFTIRIWHWWKDLGDNRSNDHPICYIKNSGKWTGPILRIENLKNIVTLELATEGLF